MSSIINIDLSILPMVIDMEQYGIKVDKDHFHTLQHNLEQECLSINDLIDHYATYTAHVNPKSSKQIAELLHYVGVFPRAGMSTANEMLDKYKPNHLIELIQSYRERKDLIDKFCSLGDKANSDSRIHTDILTTRTASGRLATKNPNLMGIPVRSKLGKEIRRGFIAERGCSFVSIDYSQIEMRVAAHVSQDEVLMDVFNRGGDIHSETCKKMFGEVTKEKRYAAKRTGFGILYGITDRGLYNIFVSDGITNFTVNDCANFIESWYGIYSGIADYIDNTRESIKQNGYITDMFGRRRNIPEIYSVHESIREAGLRQGVNHTIQSAAQGIIKTAMAQLIPVYQQYISNSYIVRPLLQIHDELLWEIQDDLVYDVSNLIKAIMENAVELSVPIRCDIEIGSNWADMAEI